MIEAQIYGGPLDGKRVTVPDDASSWEVDLPGPVTVVLPRSVRCKVTTRMLLSTDDGETVYARTVLAWPRDVGSSSTT